MVTIRFYMTILVFRVLWKKTSSFNKTYVMCQSKLSLQRHTSWNLVFSIRTQHHSGYCISTKSPTSLLFYVRRSPFTFFAYRTTFPRSSTTTGLHLERWATSIVGGNDSFVGTIGRTWHGEAAGGRDWNPLLFHLLNLPVKPVKQEHGCRETILQIKTTTVCCWSLCFTFFFVSFVIFKGIVRSDVRPRSELAGKQFE